MVIPALCNGCRETKMIEVCDFINSVAQDIEVTLNFEDGHRIAEISNGCTNIIHLV
ncbi:hypothetical protein AB3Z07_13950 [Metabacillus halosaccharovorans]|uniref:hypothetical protein n=1 Tax=Metabacillus halosaccharovorans TaxID=930124 RepID=UPI00203E4CE9|nr:hypothetical protein [Metabacillus halosaccharovorans]MCM3443827.1 hypothetical protein [Metabacillus halosaccharovorans]